MARGSEQKAGRDEEARGGTAAGVETKAKRRVGMATSADDRRIVVCGQRRVDGRLSEGSRWQNVSVGG